MKTTKKIIAVVLSVMLLLSVMPFAAFAADVDSYQSLVDEVAAFNAGDADVTITLTADVELQDTITIDTANGKTLTINGGKNITLASGVGSAFYVKQGSLNLGKNTITGAPSNYKLIYLTGSTNPEDANYSNVTIAGATINCTNGYAVMISANGNAAYGANITTKSGTVYGYYGALYVNGNVKANAGNNIANVKVSGGTLKSTEDEGTAIYGAGYANYTITSGTLTAASAAYFKAGNVTISGGTFNGTGADKAYAPNGSGYEPTGEAVVLESNSGYAPVTSVSITGGTFNSANADPIGTYANDTSVTAPDNFISGGTYKNADSSAYIVPAKYIAEGAVQDSETGTVTQAYVAEVNGVGYATFEEALAAISNVSTAKHSKAADPNYDYKTYVANGTIKLLANTTSNGIIIGSGSNLVVDFNGKTLDINAKPVGSNGTESMALQLLKNSNITFKNGTLTSSYTYSSSDTEYIQRLIQNYSNLTLDNMNVTMTGNFKNTLTISTCNGDFVVKDSTVNAPDFSAYGYTTETAAEQLGTKALAFGTFSGYTAATATVEGNSTINGNLSVGTTNPDVSTNTLSLTGGTINGDIIMSDNADSENVEITKASTFTQDAPEGYKWDDNGVLVKIVYVAEVNGVKYDTFEEALAAISNVSTAKHSKAKDPTYDYKTYVANGTIKLLANTTSNGIIIGSGSNLVIDFNGKTLDINAKPVGSNGTESIALQLLKNSNITFKNGTLTSSYTYSSSDTEYIQRLIQNYSNLTLDNMNVTMTGNFKNTLTISTCNGDFVVKDSTVNAPDFSAYGYTTETAAEQLGVKALAFGTFSGYTAATATVEGNSTINGNVSVGTTNPDVSTNTLALTGGTLNGDILMSDNADSENVEITKANTFTQDAPEGYKWVDNGDGTSTIEKVEEANNGANLTLKGNIEEAIYLDADAYNLGSDAVIKVTANANSNISETPDVQTTTYKVSELKPFVDPNGTYTGTYKFAVKNAPAQITEKVTVALYASADAQEPIKTIEYSVKDYCDTVIAESNDAKLVALCKSILDYGAAAQLAFNYNTENLAVDEFYNADAIANLDSSDIEGATYYTDYFGGKPLIQGGSIVCFSTTDMNLYVSDHFVEAESATVVGDDESAVKAVTKTRGLSKYINVTGIEADNLLKPVIVDTTAGSVEINVPFLIQTVLNYSNNATQQTLAKTIWFYATAADAYFN